ncbi:MAG: preprotein translocase subunit YajC [Pseudonocardiales bacterium]|nr:preprotein translocase subunit YajC [Actinomycetota bacterium]PZS20799.1 MAG: preprotein translocase subunit YajC [Pseudonocardiales bacterium]
MNAQFLPLLLLAVLAGLLILNNRRQKRAIADAQQLQKSLVNGDRVVTTSGLHATVVGSADDTTLDLEIAPGVRTTWLRAAIREKVTTADVASEPLATPVDGSTRADNS